MLIAHSLHGETYEVRIELRAPELDADGIVADISALRDALRATLAPLEYRNLDELPEFAGRNSTTEVLCRHIHAVLAHRLGHTRAAELQVTLVESPAAW